MDDQFEQVMIEASRGDKESLKMFYKLLLSRQFVVPQRLQPVPIKNSADYPNEFLNVLAIHDDPPFVPIFTSQKKLEEWAGRELLFREIGFLELARLIPEGWRIILDPNSDLMKEFTPWEIKTLKEEEGIDEVLDDLTADTTPVLEIEGVGIEGDRIKQSLLSMAKKYLYIKEIYLARERKPAWSDKIRHRFVVGVVIDEESTSIQNVRDEISAYVKKDLIGGDDVEVLVGTSVLSPNLSLFAHDTPIYKRQGLATFLNYIKKNLFILISLLCCIVYGLILWAELGQYVLNKSWTTDDGMQQLFPFWSAVDPSIFEGDLITKAMKSYLPPMHYWLGYTITKITYNPVITGHIIMLLQLVLVVTALGLVLKARADWGYAFIGILWFLHTRPVLQRITGGLPRGWAHPIFAVFLYFLLTRNHVGMLVTILTACFLNPPAALIIAASYGFFVLWGYLTQQPDGRRNLMRYLVLGPIYALLTYLFVVVKPPEIGGMISTAKVHTDPAFQYPYGRFPFLPLPSVWEEFKVFGLQPFVSRLWQPPFGLFDILPYIVVACFVVILWLQLRYKKELFPQELIFFLLGIITCYLLSREFVFYLFVPNRYLQVPMAFFWIIFFVLVIRNASKIISERWGKSLSVSEDTIGLSLCLFLAVFVFITSGDGLVGNCNFNYWEQKQGKAVIWVRKYTDPHSVIAGHPTHINNIPLFGMRRAYATTETAHPFYTKYFQEMLRRLEISLRAHYSRDLKEFVDVLEGEEIDYFIFSRKRFYPSALQNERYFAPLKELVERLTSRPYYDYAYKKLPKKVDLKKYPYLVYRDDYSAVVDVNALRRFLGAGSGS